MLLKVESLNVQIAQIAVLLFMSLTATALFYRFWVVQNEKVNIKRNNVGIICGRLNGWCLLCGLCFEKAVKSCPAE